MLHITPAEIRFPYTSDFTENAYTYFFSQALLCTTWYPSMSGTSTAWAAALLSSPTCSDLSDGTVKSYAQRLLYCYVNFSTVLHCSHTHSHSQPLSDFHEQPLRGMPTHTYSTQTHHCHTDHKFHNKWFEPVNSLTPVTDHSLITVHRMFTCHQLSV